MLLITLLLMVQAACALELPGYTSDLVNVGVQQGGVASPAADSLSGQAMADLKALLDEAGQERLSGAYLPRDGGFALREGLSREEKEALEDSLSLPMAALFLLSSDQTPAAVKAALPALRAGLIDKSLILNQAEERAAAQGALGDQMKRQLAIQYVRQDYAAQGLNQKSLRSRNHWRQGPVLGITASSAWRRWAPTSFPAAPRIGRSLRGGSSAGAVLLRGGDGPFSTASLITRSTNDITQIQQTSVMMLRMMLYALLAIGGISGGQREDRPWLDCHRGGRSDGLLVAVTAAVVTPASKPCRSSSTA